MFFSWTPDCFLLGGKFSIHLRQPPPFLSPPQRLISAGQGWPIRLQVLLTISLGYRHEIRRQGSCLLLYSIVSSAKWGRTYLNEGIQTKFLAQCLANGKHYKTVWICIITCQGNYEVLVCANRASSSLLWHSPDKRACRPPPCCKAKTQKWLVLCALGYRLWGRQFSVEKGAVKGNKKSLEGCHMLQGISKCVCGGWWALQGTCGATGMVRGLYEYKPGPQCGGASWTVNLWDLRQL